MTTALGISTSAHRGPITSRVAETLTTYLASTNTFTATTPFSLSPATDAYRWCNVTNCSETHLYEEEYLEIPAVRIGFVVCYVFLITVSSLGNLFLIVYVVKSARFSGHSAASPMLILSLAVCDFLRSAVLTPLKFIEYLNNQEGSLTGDAYCRTATYFVCVLGFAEFHSVAAISLERLLLICFPMKARRWLRSSNVRLAMLVIWLLAAIFSLAYVLVLCMTFELRLTSGSTYNLCTVFFFEGEPNDVSRGFSTFMFIFYYALPVLVVVVSYLMIFQILVPKPSLIVQRDKSFLSSVSSSFSAFPQKTTATTTKSGSTRRQKSGGEYLANREAASRIMKERRRLAKIMLAITLCFAVFNSPVFLSYLGIGWGRRLHKNAIFWLLVIKFFPTVSSMFNPFVYCTGRRTLKRNFRSVSDRGRFSSYCKE